MRTGDQRVRNRTWYDSASRSLILKIVIFAAIARSADLPFGFLSHEGVRAVAAENRFRLPRKDLRPDPQKLRQLGIRTITSQRLVLHTDVPEEQCQGLAELADQLFETLERQLGPLMPAEDGSEFQVTGFLINAKERFAEAGLLPPEEFPIRHGRHLGYRFWLMNQETDYYRRHLLLHEFTHCFMNCEYGMTDIPALWYTEGIAEYYATHQLPEPSEPEPSQTVPLFGILPSKVERFPGWGRISEIRRSFDGTPSSEGLDAGFTPLSTVLNPPGNRLIEDRQYAHAWALVWLINHHPDYRKIFQPLRSLRSGQQFTAELKKIPDSVWHTLAIDWLLTQDSLIEGFDIERSFPDRPVENLRRGNAAPSKTIDTEVGEGRSLMVHADRGWQFSGLRLKSDQKISLTSSGQFQIGKTSRPWISEPQGITLRYHRGRPLGELVGILVAEDGSSASRRIPIGSGTEVYIPFDAELWLQLNESAAERENNQGAVTVELSPLSEKR
ncbi:MAG: hypothetical protein ACK526_08520 [Planctomyces sp.]